MKGFMVYLCIVFLTVVGCDINESNQAVINSNTAPQLTTGQSIQILEGQQSVVALEATDKEGDSLEFTLIEGEDKSHFTLDSQGQLAFLVAPDFESPADVNGDNLYEVNISVSDGELSDVASLTIQVTNALEGRVVDGPLARAKLEIHCEKGSVHEVGQTDDNGYYKLQVPENCSDPILYSQGGMDTVTNTPVNMTLMTRLPNDSKELEVELIVTPLGSVLAYAGDNSEKLKVIRNLGLSDISVSNVKSIDPWAQSKSGNSNAIRLQKINNQIALLINTAITLVGGADKIKTNQKTAIIQAIADLSKADKVDLKNSQTVQEILNKINYRKQLINSQTMVWQKRTLRNRTFKN